MNITRQLNLLTALKATHTWCHKCQASGDSHEGGYYHKCTRCVGKGYHKKLEDEFDVWYKQYVDSEYHPEEEEDDHCLCRGAGACIQCNPGFFL